MKMKNYTLLWMVIWLTGMPFGRILSSENALTGKELQIKSTAKPFLDSLTILESAFSDTKTVFSLESVFSQPSGSFQTKTEEGRFIDFEPDNRKLKGFVSEPIISLGGARIRLVYDLIDRYDVDVALAFNYQFTTTQEPGQKIRQSLNLSLATGKPFSSIKVGMIELALLPSDIQGYLIPKAPMALGYRILSFSQSEGEPHLSYLIRDSEGVLSPVDPAEGWERTVPEFPGGRSGEYYFFSENMKYPEEALEKGLETTVLIECTIHPDGTVSDTHVFLKPDPLFNEEAIRLVNATSGHWNPAIRNGEKIEDTKVIPVTFRLPDQAREPIQSLSDDNSEDDSYKWKMGFVAFVLAAVFLYKKLTRKSSGPQPHEDTRRPDPSLKPTRLVANDKLVLIAGVTGEQLEEALTQFCNVYNQEEYLAVLRWSKMGDQLYAVTFPYDMSFECFCYFVNFICYPFIDKWPGKIMAWSTLPEEAKESVGSRAMLYIRADDEDYDNVSVVTVDGQHWRQDFSERGLLPAQSTTPYTECPYAYEQVVSQGGKLVD